MPSNKKLLEAAAGSAGGSGEFVDDLFSTYAYEGTSGTSLAINNGLDLAGEGGLVWTKQRNGTASHVLFSTDSDGNYSGLLNSNGTGSAGTGYQPTYFTFNNNGYTTTNTVGDTKVNGNDYVSWSLRQAPGFLDIVTYNGNSQTSQTLNHNLGSTPKMMIIKSTSNSGYWFVYHASLGATDFLQLQSTVYAQAYTGAFNDTAPTDTQFTVGSDSEINYSGRSYVAYLFGDDAIFGEGGDEQICKIGNFTTSGESFVDFGFEPQWLLVKATTGTAGWYIWDSMRGWQVGDIDGGYGSYNDPSIFANTNAGEVGYTVDVGYPTATGFQNVNFGAAPYVYIAIRKSMKEPTAGTEVFAMDTLGGTSPSPPSFTSGFPVDMSIDISRSTGANNFVTQRLLQDTYLNTASSNAAALGENEERFDYPNGWNSGAGTSTDILSYMFKRATKFMDVVVVKGSSPPVQNSHNLGVAPELTIIRKTNTGDDWKVGTQFTATTLTNRYLNNASVNGGSGITYSAGWNWLSEQPTDTTFKLQSFGNDANQTFMAFLFATLDGISKVGNYTGTGNSLNIDCGFSAGARFILITRSDAGGDWYLWDTFRGISAGNDPYKVLNTQVAEVTNTDYIDPLASGFTVTSSASSTVNISGATYIFLAIA